MNPLVVALIALSAQPALAEDQGEFDLHNTLLADAFDPETFFQDRYRFAPLLTIRYLGDDWDYPVYAIALFEGCHSDDPEGDRSCQNRLQARMMRAPYDGEPGRPRWRGSKLLGDLRTSGVASREALLDALDTGMVEWLEIDLAECPSGLNYAKKVEGVRWFGESLVTEPASQITIMAHFDTIDMRFRPNHYSDFRYSGYVDDDVPSGWADGFARSLENCWKPSKATPPWRRAPIEDPDPE